MNKIGGGPPPTPRGGSVRDRDPGHPKMAKIFWPPPAARKIGYCMVSNRDFTRDIGPSKVSKTSNFPASDGGRKLVFWSLQIVIFRQETLRLMSQTEEI